MTKFLFRRTLTFTIDLFTYKNGEIMPTKNSLHMHFNLYAIAGIN